MGKRIAYLDSLRGLAALVVIFSHFFGGYGAPFDLGNPFLTFPLKIVYDGTAAVSIFFVLSGFVLAWRHEMTLGLHGHTPFSLGSFYILRITRIFPAFWFALALSALCQRYFYFHPETVPAASEWLNSIWHSHFSLTDILKQATLKTGPAEHLVPQDWTLREEVRYSLLMPFLILAATRGSGWLAAFCIVGIGGFRLTPALFQFSAGVLIAKHHQQLAQLLGRWPRAALGSLLALAVVLCEMHHLASSQNTVRLLKWYIGGTGAILIVLCVLHTPALQRALSGGVFRFLGEISYSVYLLHFIMLLTVVPFCIQKLNAAGMQNENLIRFLALVALLAATVAISTASFYLIEKPGIRVGRFLIRQLTALRTRSTARTTGEKPVAETAGR